MKEGDESGKTGEAPRSQSRPVGYSQEPQGPEASEGPLGDVADGVVAQAQTAELPQHRQAAFVQARQVVVGQVPAGGTREEKGSWVKENLIPQGAATP